MNLILKTCFAIWSISLVFILVVEAKSLHKLVDSSNADFQNLLKFNRLQVVHLGIPEGHGSDSLRKALANAYMNPHTRRKRFFWSSGDDSEDEAVLTTTALTNATDYSTKPPEKKSSWRSWFSETYGKAKKTVKMTYKITKEAIKESASDIKEGFKRVGNKISRGFNKVRKYFTRSDDKFSLFANKVKERVENGDEKAIILLHKLGIEMSYDNYGKVIGSEVNETAANVRDVLKEEGIFFEGNKTIAEEPHESYSTTTLTSKTRNLEISSLPTTLHTPTTLSRSSSSEENVTHPTEKSRAIFFPEVTRYPKYSTSNKPPIEPEISLRNFTTLLSAIYDEIYNSTTSGLPPLLLPRSPSTVIYSSTSSHTNSSNTSSPSIPAHDFSTSTQKLTTTQSATFKLFSVTLATNKQLPTQSVTTSASLTKEILLAERTSSYPEFAINLTTSRTMSPTERTTSYAEFPINLTTSSKALPPERTTLYAEFPINLTTSSKALLPERTTLYAEFPINLTTSSKALPPERTTLYAEFPINLTTSSIAPPTSAKINPTNTEEFATPSNETISSTFTRDSPALSIISTPKTSTSIFTTANTYPTSTFLTTKTTTPDTETLVESTTTKLLPSSTTPTIKTTTPPRSTTTNPPSTTLLLTTPTSSSTTLISTTAMPQTTKTTATTTKATTTKATTTTATTTTATTTMSTTTEFELPAIPAESTGPPPFPDIFSDSLVRDRLHEVFLNGDFSHDDLRTTFEFDPVIYEDYYNYDYY